ncbi:MAG TPA: hypothetical protein VG102_02595 [Candidatus Paceibacterota bacterium]|nr:hypothetical protein [Candidatus Paceibacterota bacterium]
MRKLGLVLAGLLILSISQATQATWKPEYAKNPEAVQRWFKAQAIKGWFTWGEDAPAYKRLGIALCCEDAERLMTHFVGIPGKEWSYYPDPNCTAKGCKLLPIPTDVTHEEEIHALPGEDDTLPEFEAMRREGVLMIHSGKPSCFWPPDESGG